MSLCFLLFACSGTLRAEQADVHRVHTDIFSNINSSTSMLNYLIDDIFTLKAMYYFCFVPRVKVEESGERSVLILGSLCLPCVRDTA